MSKQSSQRAGFVLHRDADKFIAEDRRRRPHMPHRVAVLILDNKGKNIFLGQPRVAVENGDDWVRVPPQHHLLGTVRETATLILRDLLLPKEEKGFPVPRVHRDDLTYIGSTHGNKYQGDRIIRYGKMIHWMGVRIPHHRRIYNSESRAYGMGYWCTPNQLLSLEGATMSDRKFMMTLQAILSFAQVTQQEMPLASLAGDMLQAA